MAFGNLTVDFTRLMSVPVRDRATLAKSPQASEIFGNMTPTEIAMLFPDYYKRFIPKTSVGAAMSSGMTAPPGTMQQTTSAGGGTSGSGGATPAPSTPPPQSLVDEILQTANPADNKISKMGVGQQRLLNIIASGEGGYNSSNRGTIGNNIIGSTHSTARDGKSIPDMTIAEIMKYQAINDPNNPNRLFAVGKYQLIPDTFKGAVSFLGLKPDDKLTPEIQEKMGLYLIMEKRPAVGKYLRGESDDILAAQKALALEFASIPVPTDMTVKGKFRPTGASAYGSGNRAAHSVEEIKSVLESARQDYITENKNISTTLPGTQPEEKTKLPGSETSTDITKPDYMKDFDPALWNQVDARIKQEFDNATPERQKQIQDAIQKLGIEKIREIAERHPNASATVVVDSAEREKERLYTGSNVRYGQLGRRDNPVDPTLKHKISMMIEDIYGPEYEAVIYSGGEPTKGQKVSQSGRHDVKFDKEGNIIGGQAADVYIVNRDTGNALPREEQLKAAQYWQNKGWGGVGLGMKGGGIHLDQVQRGEAMGPDLSQRVWAYGEGGGSQAYLREEEKAALRQARTEEFDLSTITRPKPKQQTTAQPAPGPLPGTEPAQPQPQIDPETGSDVIIQKSNTNMKLGGTVSNLAQEQLSIVNSETGETKLNFNPSEEVTFNKDGRGNVDVKNEYQQRTEDTKQKTDMSDVQQQNQYAMRQTSPKESNFRETRFHEQSKEGAVQYSPSVERHVRNSRFNDSHFSRGSPNSYT